MQRSTIDADIPTLRQVRAAVTGSVIGPADTGYDEARTVFYTGIDRKPAAIVRPADAADVARVVSLARETGTELAVRSGGHSIAGYGVSEGGIVLDLSALRALEIDVEQGTAWAETGLTAGEYTTAVRAHGLATGFGDTPSVGIGGLTLGGGVGFLHRKYGLTIDSLLAAEVVTADGRLVQTDAENDPDLFWAIRGGGGNFGVATRFRFRLHPVDSVVGGMLILPATAKLVERFLSEATTAPEELSGMINVMVAPPMPFIPAEHHGQPIIMAMLVHSGPVDAAQRAMARFRALATPLVDHVRPMRYAEIYEGLDAPHPAAVAVRPLFIDGVDRGAAEGILDRLRSSTAQMSVAQFRVLGGAVARVPTGTTAFAHRDRRILAVVAAAYARPDEAAGHRLWVNAFAAELSDGEPGAYVGFLGDEGESRVLQAYPSPTWERLRKIKRQYDPTNVFRLNQNIPPRED